MTKLKLSGVQQNVMRFMSRGWPARVSHGAAVVINGQRICNVDTMKVLERLGLVERTSRSPYWVATDRGRQLSSEYAASEDD